MSNVAALASDGRRALLGARSIVVKIGSKALASDPKIYERLATGVAAATKARRAVTLVSSGAIVLGVKKLGLAARPKEMALLQAAAAAGQTVLMRAYEDSFAKCDLSIAQVLLTHADLADRTRSNNAREALAALLAANVVPIINENDTVAVDEIRFGDNDLLASLVVPLVGADLLILLSDVPGLLDQSGQRVTVVQNIAKEARPLAGGSTSGVGTGGMQSKVEAAHRATLAGASVVVADARHPEPINAILAGDDVGTLFLPHPQRIQARKHWIAFTLRSQGAILLDRGAAEAITTQGRSLLPVGVLGVRGEFNPGDAVTLLDHQGQEIGRGLARMGASEVAAVAGKRGEDLSARGYGTEAVVVHRDDLVLAHDDGAV